MRYINCYYYNNYNQWTTQDNFPIITIKVRGTMRLPSHPDSGKTDASAGVGGPYLLVAGDRHLGLLQIGAQHVATG